MSDYLHECKYFIFQVKNEFEPVATTAGAPQLYQRVEYATLGCNCGEVMRRKITTKT